MTQQRKFSRLFRLFLVGAFALTSLTLMSLSGVTRRASAQGDVLLQDTFDDNTNNWTVASTKYTDVAVGSGMLTLHTKGGNHAGWVTPDQTVQDDLQLEVDAQPDSPDSSGEYNFGVILRADARDLTSSFYQFDVDGTSNWSFSLRTANGDKYEPVKTGTLKNFDPTAVTHFKVVAQGDSFTYSVNGTKLGTFKDTTLSNPDTEKYVGLVVSNYQQVNDTTVNFSNLTVTAVSGGSASSQPTATPKKGSKATPTKPSAKKTPTQAATEPAAGNVLLQDDFTDNTNNWLIGKTTNTQVSIADNTLAIKVNKSNLFQRSTPQMTFPSDVDVTVTAQNPNPDDTGDWNYGIGIRGRTESDNEIYYLFRITGHGTWLFLSRKGGDTTSTIVDETNIDNFDASAANEMRIIAVGSHFDFYLNGVKLGEADDDSLSAVDQNELYLTAGTFENSTAMEADFTNLVVAEPAQ